MNTDEHCTHAGVWQERCQHGESVARTTLFLATWIFLGMVTIKTIITGAIYSILTMQQAP